MTTPGTTQPSAGGGSTAPGALNLRALLEEVMTRDASDLHLTAGERPDKAFIFRYIWEGLNHRTVDSSSMRNAGSA